MKEGMQSSRWQVGVLACLVLVHAVLFMFLAWLKYESFSFGDIDLALLNGGMWNLVHGQPSYSGGTCGSSFSPSRRSMPYSRARFYCSFFNHSRWLLEVGRST